MSDHSHGNYDAARDKFLGTITRARMRLDGFVSVDAEYTGGEFTTPALLFSGNQLTLNTDTSAGGHVRVELQNESAQPLAGFSAEECDPINGNFIQKVVSWHGKPSLAGLGRKARSSAICDARCETLFIQVRMREGRARSPSLSARHLTGCPDLLFLGVKS